MTIIERLAAEQGHRCCYCGHLMIRHVSVYGYPTPRNAMTKDHVQPRVYGGQTTMENMVAACCQCNNLRGEMDAIAFYNLMQKWLRRDTTLWVRWHSISREELYQFKLQTLATHERQLSGLARRVVECAFRHYDFTWRERRKLGRA